MTQEELVLLQDKITRAEKAYESLMLGTMARVFVDQNGERVEFVAANRDGLYRYIQELKSQLPAAQGFRPRTGRPLGFFF